MDKAFFKRILTVIMGICALMLLFSFISLIIDIIGLSDILEHGWSSSEKLFSKWSSVAALFLLITLFVSYLFTFLSKNVIFQIIAAAFSLFTAVCTIAFIAVFRHMILDDWSSTAYEIFTAYIQEMMQIIVPCIIGCIFYTVNSVRAFIKKPVETAKEDNTL